MNKIKKAIEHINITEEMQTDILKNLRNRTSLSTEGITSGHSQTTHKKSLNIKTGKILSMAAAALLVIGIISVPVQAGIRHLIRERMESLPEEEISAISEMLPAQDMSEGDADKFSRSYTQDELSRKAELFKAYQNGTFPERELLRITDEAQRAQDMLCYNETNSLFYLPDRELTDEELLQIIDFNYKRDYALEQSPEAMEVHAEQEKEQKQLEHQISESDGIEETEAIEAVRGWMDSFFSLSTEGMEQNCYLEDSYFEVPVYCITFSIQSNCYYYFYVNSLDGSLMQVSVSLAKWLDDETTISKENAGEQAENAFTAAKSFLEEKLDIHEDYQEVHCFYYLKDGVTPGKLFWLYFFREDGSAYRLSLRGTDCALTDFCLTDQENYYETLERAKSDSGRTIVEVALK